MCCMREWLVEKEVTPSNVATPSKQTQKNFRVVCPENGACLFCKNESLVG